jgi:AhpD family alkylhydroperoxidase
MLTTARMANPALALPDALSALQALAKAIDRADVPLPIELLHLRASQINGCAVCVHMHAKAAAAAGESVDRLISTAAWRETPFFTDAERAALALTEALTRLADRADPVPDHIWDAVAEHYDEEALAAVTMSIALVNLWNRLNIATGQVVSAS